MPSETEPIAGSVRLRPLAPGVHALRQRSRSGLTVNLYVLEGDDGLTLVDAGFPNRAADVDAAIGALGHALGDLARVVYTHTHIDHMGGGPALAEATSAEHLVWHESVAVAADWQAHQRRLERWGPWLAELLPPEPVVEAMRLHRAATRVLRERERRGPSRIAPVRPLYPGERAPAGPFWLEPVPAPGHDPQHVVLYDSRAKVAFTGDVVLPIATPLARPMGDDTASYLATLDRLQELEVTVAYPGHGAPITQWERRVERSREFVVERLQAVRATLGERGPLPVFEIARAMAGEWADDMSRFPLILANVDSSVQYLVAEGQLVRDDARIRLA